MYFIELIAKCDLEHALYLMMAGVLVLALKLLFEEGPHLRGII